jgi:hypothetical protein
MGGISRSGGSNHVICTSITRPTLPFEGLEIFETDTNRAWIYTGTQWVMQVTTGFSIPRFKVSSTGPAAANGQACANGANVGMTFAPSSEVDTDSLVSGGIFTCPATMFGVWHFGFCTFWDTNASGLRAAWLQDNTGIRYAQMAINAISGGTSAIVGSVDITLSAGMTVQVFSFQTSGVSLQSNWNSSAFFQGRYVGAT